MKIIVMGFNEYEKEVIGKKLGEFLKWECISIKETVTMYFGEKNLSDETSSKEVEYFKEELTTLLTEVKNCIVISCKDIVLREELIQLTVSGKNSLAIYIKTNEKNIVKNLFNNEEICKLKEESNSEGRDVESRQEIIQEQLEKRYEKYSNYIVSSDEDDIEDICKKIVEKVNSL